MKEKITAIILAGGKGKRMHTDIPKQYLMLNDKPVLFYSLRAFSESSVNSIILVTGEEEIEYCKKEIVEKYGFEKVDKIVSGGEERYHSVFAGLCAVEDADYVLIHDGARPLIQKETIEKAISAMLTNGACIVGVPAKDTVQIVSEQGTITETPARSKVWLAQTPQCFSYSCVYDAYRKALENGDTLITDDAMVVRKYSGEPVHMICGSYTNIKITNPEDLSIASELLRQYIS